MERRNNRRSVLGDRRSLVMDSKSMDKEDIVMTASRHEDCSMIRLERKCQSEIDNSQIHFIGGGPYKGILVNKMAPSKYRCLWLLYCVVFVTVIDIIAAANTIA
ncbi:uncharacterized protein LOC118767234 [Octopus sinensis]|uniref:Uncharacterized protein LOC118767234 n=1 Tax=Octopus sinensis TaxID=2607531 RepID=A0A7E6FJ59_9MOLL|nr:uncharacterized protein LOC118767234 [Octopus sinensis]